VAAQHYAARFAAKEAALKALQTGWKGGIGWQDVEVASRDGGAPYLIFHGQVQELFAKSGADTAHLTLSHTSEHAIAEVILERRD
jgi:holo-[acyl-carrier protein] synthase